MIRYNDLIPTARKRFHSTVVDNTDFHNEAMLRSLDFVESKIKTIGIPENMVYIEIGYRVSTPEVGTEHCLTLAVFLDSGNKDDVQTFLNALCNSQCGDDYPLADKSVFSELDCVDFVWTRGKVYGRVYSSDTLDDYLDVNAWVQTVLGGLLCDIRSVAESVFASCYEEEFVDEYLRAVNPIVG